MLSVNKKDAEGLWPGISWTALEELLAQIASQMDIWMLSSVER
jgi:hypothetical protein